MTWSNEPLQRLIDTLESGSRPTGGASTDSGEVFSIGGENILQSGGITLEYVKRVPVAFFNSMAKGHLCVDDVLINKDGAQTGKVGWYRPDNDLVSCINEHVFLLRCVSDRITQGYLYYSLLSDSGQAQLRMEISGSAQPGLKAGFTKGVIVEFPTDIREQKMIVRVLSTVDQAIEQTEALIAKQRRIKTGLMQDLLTRGIDEHGNLRSEQTHKFKDSPLGRIPMEWDYASLAVFVPSAEYGISTSLGETGDPVLRMNNLLDGEAELSDLKFTDAPVPEQLWLRDGDVLFNRTNSWEHVGRTGIWRGQTENATFASYLVRLNPHPDKLLPEMLNYWLNWERTQIAMRRQATPAVQQVNINPTNLRSIPAAFPKYLDEQVAITARVAALREVLSAHGEHLCKLKSLKVGLMQDLLTGENRVTALLASLKQVVGT